MINSSTTTKVLLDTDIGSDLDDSLAIAYLLAQSRCKLLGITTVTGHPRTRAGLASMFCVQAGVSIPIHVGSADGLTGPTLQPDVPQRTGLEAWPHSEPDGDNAAQFIIDTVARHPGKITILGIGPLTNIARALLQEPTLASQVHEIVFMGGQLETAPDRPQAEWNILNDPEAAEIVLASAVPCRIVPLDVTHKIRWGVADLRSATRAAPILLPALDMAEPYFDQHADLFLHDPLAASLVFKPDLCSYRTGEFRAILTSSNGLIRGQTVFRARSDGPHRVATTVEVNSFVDHFDATVRGFEASAGGT